MKYLYAKYTDIGARQTNEDSLGIQSWNSTLLAVVADGLGGHSNGEIASRIAVDTILSKLYRQDLDEDSLAYAIIDASHSIRKNSDSGFSTAAALWIQDGHAVAAHIGDSRIYQFRNGKIIYQTLDHSLVQMAVLVGKLKPDALRNHPDRNQLFRVLGDHDEDPKIDSTELSVQAGDHFLLCSDGFWEHVTESDMISTASESNDPGIWLESMKTILCKTQSANQDNHTAICIIIS